MSEFLKACLGNVFRGGKLYWAWVLALGLLSLVGFLAYVHQLRHGLAVTGMTDQVTWGVYIANFTFLVGVAAAAVMLVIPAYIFHRKDAKHVVLLGEGVAVAACAMAMLFVVVDLGRPDRFWHMIPGIGRFNFPTSLLAWDVVALSGYLCINLAIPFYLLYTKYRGKAADLSRMIPVIVVAIIWAIGLHTVTAFLYSANAGRPFWHSALLGPRFLASAFAAGPAFIIIAFHFIERVTDFKVPDSAVRLLALIATGALQVNLFMVGAEVFTEFYAPTAHSHSAHYLFLGLGEARALVPWIYSALALNILALGILLIRPLRENRRWLLTSCVLLNVGIWIEKGMGLIIPGFVPTPLGEIVEYSPSAVETLVSMGIWSLGFLIFTLLAKASIPIELGQKAGAEA